MKDNLAIHSAQYTAGYDTALAESRKACPCECHHPRNIDHDHCGLCAAAVGEQRYDHGCDDGYERRDREVGAELAASVLEARLEDCGAVCRLCRGKGFEDTPYRVDDGGGFWLHASKGEEPEDYDPLCEARRIHELIYKAKRKEAPTDEG